MWKKENYYELPDIGALENQNVSKMLYYVNPTLGNSTNHGRSPSVPLQYFSQAWAKIHNDPKAVDYCIYLMKGDYNSSANPIVLEGDKKFTAQGKLTIQSYSPIMDERAKVFVTSTDGSTFQPCINLKTNDYVTVDRIKFLGVSSQAVNNYGVVAEAVSDDMAENIVVSRCDFYSTFGAEVNGIKGLGNNATIMFNTFVNNIEPLTGYAEGVNTSGYAAVIVGDPTTGNGADNYKILNNTVHRFYSFLAGCVPSNSVVANNVFSKIKQVGSFPSPEPGATVTIRNSATHVAYSIPFVAGSEVVMSGNGNVTVTDATSTIELDKNNPNLLLMNYDITSVGYCKLREASAARNIANASLLAGFGFIADHDCAPIDITATLHAGASQNVEDMTLYALGASGNTVAEFRVLAYNAMQLNHVNLPGGIGRRAFDQALPNTQIPQDDYYYVKDHLGSTRVVCKETDGSDAGVVPVEIVDYYPFGKEQNRGWNFTGSASPLTVTKERFTGKEFDQDGRVEDGNIVKVTGIGLSFFGKRYFDSEIAQWTSTDPMLEYNSPYNYVGNNPITRFDPNGLWTAQLGLNGLGGGGVGGTFSVGLVMSYDKHLGLDFGIYTTEGIGAEFGAGGSVNIEAGYSRNKSIFDLSGISSQTGGSYLVAGGDVSIPLTGSSKPLFTGNVGVKANFMGGAEGHEFVTSTQIHSPGGETTKPTYSPADQSTGAPSDATSTRMKLE